MERTASGSEALPGPVFEGWNIGSVSVKRVRLHEDGEMETDLRRHGGYPGRTIRLMLEHCGRTPDGAVVTGPQAVSFLSLPYLPESICIEAALGHLGLHPDLVLSLGGESLVVYCTAGGSVRRMMSVNGYSEAPMTIGRYANLLASGAFDGDVNIGAFNCAPANAASAVIHALSIRSDTPYAVIESDGDCITAGQLRQLETVAVQCRRRREALDERLPA